MDSFCIVCQRGIQIVQNKACDCQFCYECCLQWMEEQMTQNSKILSFKCLNSKCKEKIRLDSFYKSISDPKIGSKYQEITFKNIKACPNQNCNNAGMIPPSKCEGLLECNLCGYKWFDIDCLSFQKQFQLFFNNLKNDTLCHVQKFMNAHNCPNCNVLIIKNGGCAHMTCKNCTYEYCYQCNQVEAGHDSQLCNSRQRLSKIFHYYLIFIQAYFFGVHFLIYQIWLLIVYLFELLIQSDQKLFFYFLLHFTLTLQQIQAGKFKTRRWYIHPIPRKFDIQEICFQLYYLFLLLPLGILIYLSRFYETQIIQIYQYLPQIIYIVQFSNITFLIIVKNIKGRKPQTY